MYTSFPCPSTESSAIIGSSHACSPSGTPPSCSSFAFVPLSLSSWLQQWHLALKKVLMLQHTNCYVLGICTMWNHLDVAGDTTVLRTNVRCYRCDYLNKMGKHLDGLLKTCLGHACMSHNSHWLSEKHPGSIRLCLTILSDEFSIGPIKRQF